MLAARAAKSYVLCESMTDIFAQEIELPDDGATRSLGAALAAGLSPGLCVYLRGELGAGKTTLAQGLLAALGHPGRVKSPTYTLLELYTLSSLNLYHFDFYRFRDSNEWRDAGFSDYFGSDGICLVEWPEKAGDELPRPDVEIILRVHAQGRIARIAALTVAGAKCCESLTRYSSQKKSF